MNLLSAWRARYRARSRPTVVLAVLIHFLVFFHAPIKKGKIRQCTLHSVTSANHIWIDAYPFTGLLVNNCLFSGSFASLEFGDFSSVLTSRGEPEKANILAGRELTSTRKKLGQQKKQTSKQTDQVLMLGKIHRCPRVLGCRWDSVPWLLV